MELSALEATDESLGTARIRWRRVGFWAFLVGLVPFTIAILLAAASWMPLFPKDLGRSITEGFLRTFLVGYAAAILISSATFIVLGWILIGNRREFFRKRFVPRFLLAGSTLFLCLLLTEACASVWLSWIHRLPSLPTRFPEAASSDEEISIVVIGGSAALGYPYKSDLSIGRIVGWQIEQLVPGKTVRVEILAKMGANLEQMHQALAKLKRKPDAIIINSGNNEFLSRFEPQRNAGLSEIPLNPILAPLYALSLRSPLCRLVYETISKNRLGGKPTPVFHPRLIDPPVFTPSEFASVFRDFQRRLEAIVSYCDRIGALPILVIPPANLSGYEPNRNALPDRVTLAERDEIETRFDETRKLEEVDAAKSIAGYKEIIKRWPELAEAHFRLGRLFEKAGNWDEARLHYHAAKELDGFPIRVLDKFQNLYRELSKNQGCLLVDGPRLFESLAPHALVGDDYFHDAHHPTLRGNAALAEAVVRGLHDRRAFGWPANAPAPKPIELDECLKRFPIDTEDWYTVCTCTATFYRDLANIRYDPSERKARQHVYESAMRKLREGTAPEQLGIPGMGLLKPGAVASGWWDR